LNTLKSIFISTYMMAVITIAAIATGLAWKTSDYLLWGGVLLTTVPFILVIGRLAITHRVARTSARFPVVNALGSTGVLMAAGGYFFRTGDMAGSVYAPIIALSAWVGFILYAYWYSSFGRQSSQQLQVGRTLPEFKLKDIRGNLISSVSLTDKPTVWMFYRGAWCPLCVAQINELVAQYQQLQGMGARVALVSPQPHGNTVKMAEKFGVDFDFLTDEGNRAGRALGIENPQGIPMGMQMLGYDSETVLPTVIITDAGGEILWAHETDNYRVRPDPDIYLAVLREKSVVVAGVS